MGGLIAMVSEVDRIWLAGVARAAAQARGMNRPPELGWDEAAAIERELYRVIGEAVEQTCALAVAAAIEPASLPQPR